MQRLQGEGQEAQPGTKMEQQDFSGPNPRGSQKEKDPRVVRAGTTKGTQTRAAVQPSKQELDKLHRKVQQQVKQPREGRLFDSVWRQSLLSRSGEKTEGCQASRRRGDVPSQQPRGRDADVLSTFPGLSVAEREACEWLGESKKLTKEHHHPDADDAGSVEMRRQRFRHFCYQEGEGPGETCRQLQELCYQWLKPERHTKEQVVQLVILEQFLTILPQEMQIWVCQGGPATCAQAVALAESFLLRLQEAEIQEQKMSGLLEEAIANSSGSDQDPSDTTEIQFSVETKEAAAILLEHNGQRLENMGKEAFLVEIPGLLEQGISLGRSKRKRFQDPEMENTPASREGELKIHQENHPGKPVKQALYSVEADKTLHERTLEEGLCRYKAKKRGADNRKILHLSTDNWRTQRRENPSKGATCGEKNSQHFTFPSHERIDWEGKPHQCSECGKSFSQKGNLIRHKRTHTGEKPYQCSECGKRFITNTQLGTHQRVHTGEKPYKCSYCENRFSQLAHLVQHERKHTGEKPYSCSHCGKCFSVKANLITHKRTHTGEKPYECPECPKSFISSSDLKKHKKVHTGNGIREIYCSPSHNAGRGAFMGPEGTVGVSCKMNVLYCNI